MSEHREADCRTSWAVNGARRIALIPDMNELWGRNLSNDSPSWDPLPSSLEGVLLHPAFLVILIICSLSAPVAAALIKGCQGQEKHPAPAVRCCRDDVGVAR